MKKVIFISISLIFVIAVIYVSLLYYQNRGILSESNSSNNNTEPKKNNTSQTEKNPPSFIYAINKVTNNYQNSMLKTGSWRTECPVKISSLRVLTLTYFGFDGKTHQGEIMVNKDVSDSVIRAFHLLFNAHYPIHRMNLVEVYGADDEKSMLADNTSGFNCRGIPGSTEWSQHAYGRAVDINPFENPEIRNGVADPVAASKFKNRDLKINGMIRPGDTAVRAFSAVGWSWGGYWDFPKDYQHFSLSGT